MVPVISPIAKFEKLVRLLLGLGNKIECQPKINKRVPCLIELLNNVGRDCGAKP